MAIMGGLRVALAFGYHPSDPSRRALRMTKNNLGPLEDTAWLLEPRTATVEGEEQAAFVVTSREPETRLPCRGLLMDKSVMALT